MRKALAWVGSNWSSFTLAFLLAVAVWIIANQEQNPVQEADFRSAIPITVTGVKDGLVISNTLPTSTHLRLRAQQSTWLSISGEDLLVTLDLSGLGPGTFQVPLRIDVATRALVVSANPANVQVVLEEDRQQEESVKIILEGEPLVGYTTGVPISQPSRVLAQGPLSAIERINEVRASVPVGELRDAFNGKVSLTAYDADGKAIDNVSLDPPEVDVVVPVTQQAGYRDIAIVAKTIGQPASGYYVTGIKVLPDLITVQGDANVIAGMLPYAETQPVNLAGVTDNLISDVTLVLPPGVSPVNADSIQMLVTVQPLQGSRSILAEVQAVGLGQGLAATFSPASITVIASGPVPVLDQLNPFTDVLVTVELNNLGIGTYQLEPLVRLLHRELTVESVFPVTVSVTIKSK
jgi:YbbR domain-containing protein